MIFTQPISCEQCFVPGKCMNNGGYYGETVSSVEDCIVLCDKGICKWSTFDPNNGQCELFLNVCQEVDYKKCPLCLNNERDCISCK